MTGTRRVCSADVHQVSYVTVGFCNNFRCVNQSQGESGLADVCGDDLGAQLSRPNHISPGSSHPSCDVVDDDAVIVDACENSDNAETLPRSPDNPFSPADKTHPISTLWADLTAAEMKS